MYCLAIFIFRLAIIWRFRWENTFTFCVPLKTNVFMFSFLQMSLNLKTWPFVFKLSLFYANGFHSWMLITVLVISMIIFLRIWIEIWCFVLMILMNLFILVQYQFQSTSDILAAFTQRQLHWVGKWIIEIRGCLSVANIPMAIVSLSKIEYHLMLIMAVCWKILAYNWNC